MNWIRGKLSTRQTNIREIAYPFGTKKALEKWALPLRPELRIKVNILLHFVVLIVSLGFLVSATTFTVTSFILPFFVTVTVFITAILLIFDVGILNNDKIRED